MNVVKVLDTIAPLALECICGNLDYEDDYLFYADKHGVKPVPKHKYEQVERIFDKDVERYCSMQAKQYSCPSIVAEERYYEQE